MRSAAQHFERVAGDYARLRHLWPLGMLRRQEQRALRALVRVQPGERVLDAGCGDGETLAWLTAQRVQPVGVDVALGMAAHCRRRGFLVAVQDMECLGMRPCFDWVLCVGALEFTADPGHAIRSLASCLRPRGKLALLFPRRNWLTILYAAYHRAHGVRIRLFTCEDVSALMIHAGLRPQPGWRDGWASTVAVAERTDGPVEPQT
jgi:SAM-dependent methyltransferase